MYTVHTFLYTLLKVLTCRTCLTTQSFFSCSSSFILGTSDVQFRSDIVRTNKILDTLRGQKVEGKVTNCRGWGEDATGHVRPCGGLLSRTRIPN